MTSTRGLGRLATKHRAGYLCDPPAMRRVMDELDRRLRHLQAGDPIEEQLTSCPDAFLAGRLVARTFDRLIYREPAGVRPPRLLPPAGRVRPPLV